MPVTPTHPYTPGPLPQETLQVLDPTGNSDELSLMRKEGGNSYTTDRRGALSCMINSPVTKGKGYLVGP